MLAKPADHRDQGLPGGEVERCTHEAETARHGQLSSGVKAHRLGGVGHHRGEAAVEVDVIKGGEIPQRSRSAATALSRPGRATSARVKKVSESAAVTRSRRYTRWSAGTPSASARSWVVRMRAPPWSTVLLAHIAFVYGHDTIRLAEEARGSRRRSSHRRRGRGLRRRLRSTRPRAPPQRRGPRRGCDQPRRDGHCRRRRTYSGAVRRRERRRRWRPS